VGACQASLADSKDQPDSGRSLAKFSVVMAGAGSSGMFMVRRTRAMRNRRDALDVADWATRIYHCMESRGQRTDGSGESTIEIVAAVRSVRNDPF